MVQLYTGGEGQRLTDWQADSSSGWTPILFGNLSINEEP